MRDPLASRLARTQIAHMEVDMRIKDKTCSPEVWKALAAALIAGLAAGAGLLGAALALAKHLHG